MMRSKVDGVDVSIARALLFGGFAGNWVAEALGRRRVNNGGRSASAGRLAAPGILVLHHACTRLRTRTHTRARARKKVARRVAGSFPRRQRNPRGREDIDERSTDERPVFRLFASPRSLTHVTDCATCTRVQHKRQREQPQGE